MIRYTKGSLFDAPEGSVLIHVPWERTKKIINTLLPKYPHVKWVVYTGE